MKNKSWMGVAAAALLVNAACDGSKVGDADDAKATEAQGERLVGVLTPEQGGCPWSADADANGDIFTVSTENNVTTVSSLNVFNGMKWSRALENTFSVVRSDRYSDRVMVSHWYEDPAQGVYGWNTALLNKQGEVQQFDAKGPDPYAPVDARKDGKRLEIPWRNRTVDIIHPDGRRNVVFDARAFDMTVGAASFMEDSVVIAGVAKKQMMTPLGTVGLDGERWIAAARVALDGEILWAQHIQMAVPEEATPVFNIGTAKDTVFVTGGASKADFDKQLNVVSFLAMIDGGARAKSFRAFENADAPSMVVTSNGKARLIVPIHAASGKWDDRALRHVIVDENDNVQLETTLREEGENGFQFRQLLKAGDRAVVVGCFYGMTSISGQAVMANGYSGFAWLLDPK